MARSLLVLTLAAAIGGGCALAAYRLGQRDGLAACPEAAAARLERDRLLHEWMRTLPVEP